MQWPFQTFSSKLNSVLYIELFSKLVGPKVLDFISYRPVSELLDGWLKTNKIKAQKKAQPNLGGGGVSIGEELVPGGVANVGGGVSDGRSLYGGISVRGVANIR